MVITIKKGDSMRVEIGFLMVATMKNATSCELKLLYEW